jgi:AMMECR1 domain-containing protein
VHLPFLQLVLGDFTLVPVIVGGPSPRETNALLQALWGGPETLIVISSDLSHYHNYDGARQRDHSFCRHEETLNLEQIEDEQACGRFPVKGLLTRARALDLRVTTLDIRNSGDTGGREQRDRLRGCIGSILPHRSLIEDVATNAFKATFGDPRFPKLTQAELAELDLSVSILSHARPIAFDSEAEAVKALQPDVDGVILQANGPDGQTKRGLFLPQV